MSHNPCQQHGICSGICCTTSIADTTSQHGSGSVQTSFQGKSNWNQDRCACAHLRLSSPWCRLKLQEVLPHGLINLHDGCHVPWTTHRLFTTTINDNYSPLGTVYWSCQKTLQYAKSMALKRLPSLEYKSELTCMPCCSRLEPMRLCGSS